MEFTQDQAAHDRLRMLRTWKRMTQKEVAANVGTSQRRYCDWETGKRVPSTKFQERLSAYWKSEGCIWE